MWAGLRFGVVKPLTKYTEQTEQISRGHLDTNVEDLKRLDEIGNMARVLDVFRNDLIETQKLRADQEKQKKKLKNQVSGFLNEVRS